MLTAEEARKLLDSVDISTVIGLRDRALTATMLFTFARVSAAVGMKVDDYYQIGKRSWIRLREKGGKNHAVPARHSAKEYFNVYSKAVGLSDLNRRDFQHFSTKRTSNSLYDATSLKFGLGEPRIMANICRSLQNFMVDSIDASSLEFRRKCTP